MKHDGEAVATLLIADPDPAVTSLLELLLLRLGHRPIREDDLERGEEPDLVLVEPSSRTSLALARRLKEGRPQLPILCVSVEAPGDASLALAPAGYLMKPFRRADLERAVETALVPGRLPAGA